MWRTACYLLLLILATPAAAFTDGPPIRIGVLSHRGSEATLKNWSPTADYLSKTVPGRRFEIIPLDFAEVEPAVKFSDVDFILVNPGIYVNLEVRYRVSRIATLNNRAGYVSHNVFGGVIFTRRDRADIKRITDLKGKRFMAVDQTSLGGFQMAWGELQRVGIDPYKDFSSIQFGGIHDDVVQAVLRGDVDAGTVRTDILERMDKAKLIDLRDFKVVGPRQHPEFFFQHSTSLYPEWPFSKVQHTPNELAQRVAVALLNMPPQHPAADAGSYAGWTVPLDYQPVHDLFRELKLPPYQATGRFTLEDAVKKYWYWLVVGIAFILSMAFMTTWVFRLNRQLAKSNLHLEQHYELILNSVADGIYGVDLKGNSTFVNRAMEQITGWRADELIGANQHQVLHHTKTDGSPFPKQECPVDSTYMDSTARFVDDDIFWKKNGASFPVEYASSPIKDYKGNTVGSVVVFRDISERKKAEEEARQHQLDLAHVARLSTLGEMASGIAHELNQPLTAIATNAQASIRMIEGGSSNPDRLVDTLERIGSQAERAGEIIRHLRQLVRKEQPELSRVNINDVVNEVVVLLKPEARKANVTIRLELDAEIGEVLAQHVQIDQVILNLARNAIEAMSENTKTPRALVIKTARTDNGNVAVTVADTGPGLSAQVKDQVFDPFVTTKPNGMGLGLSISQSIIEAHKGQLYLDSVEGYGAVFRFLLPMNRGDSDSDV